MVTTDSGLEVPPAVALLRDFVNSADLQDGVEAFSDPRSTTDWCVSAGLLGQGDELSKRDRRRLLGLREGVRNLLLGHAGHVVEPAAVADLNAGLSEVVLRAEFDVDGRIRLASRSGVGADAVTAALLSAVRTATEDRTWDRLKVCAKDSCRWAFYDASRNRSGRWCSMAGCGNQVKMRRAYAVRRGRAEEPRSP